MSESGDPASTGTVAVVTGGANGIGAAIARSYASDPAARVTILDLDEEAGERLAGELGNLHFQRCDVTREAEVKAGLTSAAQERNRIDILVNNAAIQEYQSIQECTEADWDRILAVNLKSYFLCAHHALEALQRSAAPVIVNMGSANSFVSMRGATPYVTSKAAVLGLTRSIAVDCAPWLRCVAVCPGAVDTPALRRDLAAVEPEAREQLLEETRGIHLTGRIASADEVAAFVRFIASPAAPSATGQAYRIDGGIGVRIEGT